VHTSLKRHAVRWPRSRALAQPGRPMALAIGVIGVGVMGHRHADNIAGLAPRARLLGVADSDAVAARSAADCLGADWYANSDDLLARSDIQAVVIATGSDTHADLVVRAADRGKDILCEKPLALTVSDAERAAAAAKAKGVRLQVGFMRRYDPAYKEAFEAIARGDIGHPVLFAGISRDAQPPPRSYFTGARVGGLFIDSGNHDFDLARWLMQDEVSSVWASGGVIASPELADVQPIDVGLATLTFRNGAIGTVALYRRAVYGYDIRTEVLGTEGAVTIGDQRKHAVRVLRPGRSIGEVPMHWLDRFAEAYRLEMSDWVARMAADRPPAITATDGIRAVQLSVAADESRATCSPINLPR
jgi:predicted dehydrogenase